MDPLTELSSPSNPEIDVEGSHDDEQTVEEIVYVGDEDGSYIEEIIDEEDCSYIEEIVEEVTVTELEPDGDDDKADENRLHSSGRSDSGTIVIDRVGGKNDANEGARTGYDEDASSSDPGYDDDSSVAALSADSDAPAYEEDLGRSFREDAGVDLLTKRRREIQEEIQKAAMSEGARKAREEELARQKARGSQNEDECIDETEQRMMPNDTTESTRRKQREALLRQKQQDEAARRRLEEEIRKVDMALARKRETAAQTRIEGAQQVEKRRQALAELRRQSAREELACSNEALKAEREAKGLSNFSITPRNSSTRDRKTKSEKIRATDVMESLGPGAVLSNDVPKGAKLLSPLAMDVTPMTGSDDMKSLFSNEITQEFIAPTPHLANTQKLGGNTDIQSAESSAPMDKGLLLYTIGGGDIFHGATNELLTLDDLRKKCEDQKSSGVSADLGSSEVVSMGDGVIAEQRRAQEIRLAEENPMAEEALSVEEARVKADEPELSIVAEDTRMAGSKAKEEKRIAEEKAAEEEVRWKEIEEKRRGENAKRSEEATWLKAEDEARLENEKETRLKAENDARLKAGREQAYGVKVEEEAKLDAEKDARLMKYARLKAEEEARLKAEEEAKLKTEKEVKLNAEEDTRLRAGRDAKLQAEQEAFRLKAKEEDRVEKRHLVADKARNEQKQRLPRISVGKMNEIQSREQEELQTSPDSSLPRSPVGATRKKLENKSTAVPAVFNLQSPVGQARKKFEKPKTQDESSLPVSPTGASRRKSGNHEMSEGPTTFQAKKPSNSSVLSAFRTKSSTRTAKSADKKGAVTTSSIRDGKYYPIDDLRARKIEGLDYTCREQYLSPEDFQEYFKMAKDEFGKLPKWKRDKAKRSLKLF